jgi:hypothetical protein
MGTWGHKTFENDTAGDWVYELEKAEDSTLLRATLEKVTKLPATAYLEAPECCEALAAAEVVAALLGRPAGELPEDVGEWVEAHGGKPEPALAPLALQALARVRTTSELKELWDDGDDPPQWYAGLDDLERRLKG